MERDAFFTQEEEEPGLDALEDSEPESSRDIEEVIEAVLLTREDQKPGLDALV